MKPAICTAILLLLSSGLLVLHEMLMQTWRPMFVSILLSFAVALVVAFLGFRRSEAQARTVQQAIIFSCVTVFLFSTVWGLLWAVSEEGLVHYYLATYGHDDTGGRYFYPGNSGMGYAKGLSRPVDLIFWTLVRGVSLAAIIGVPLAFIIAWKKSDSEQNGGGQPATQSRQGKQ
ncbi:MAG: hypothetical protein AB7I98_16990 [Verrucomicrobiales bacterium]|nr:hypothetical protein [Akkermansiaceae bacterium]